LGNFLTYKGKTLPVIAGAGGGSKGTPKIDANSLFSTDILFIVNAIGEGPVYRVNPNGPQDIQVQDSSIDDLLFLEGNGAENTDKFKTLTATGTTVQGSLSVFGDSIVTPQNFSSAVTLKKGNLAGVPASSITLQDTSNGAWDILDFNFIVSKLYKGTSSGGVLSYSVGVKVDVYDDTSSNIIATASKVIKGKTDISFKFTIRVIIPETYKSANGYKFSVSKTTDDSSDAKIGDDIKITGWNEIESSKQAYPRTALIGYAIKATNEHTGGVPNFTSMVKGLLVKVPSNYNQPILPSGDIDWRQLEVPTSYLSSNGYRLQKSGTSTVNYSTSPEIYTGTWDGTFVYAWTQNPVWIVYDILTNNTYGLGIPEKNIDKYKFYQVAQYCDACDDTTGVFYGVEGIADGSYRYKPQGTYTKVKENQVGLPSGTIVPERRFTLDLSLVDQQLSIDVLNSITATFRGILIYSGGKISLAVDMPDMYPVMLFNEASIKKGSITISGSKEESIVTGVDVSYIEPTNHFKREVVRVDSQEFNDGLTRNTIDNILSLDLQGVTRRGQAIRAAQYHIASSKYLRRHISFETGTEALSLAPGDVIAIAVNGTGVAYGYGGKIINSSSSDANVTLEHFTVPAITSSLFTSNTYPLAMRIISHSSDKQDLYILSNSSYNIYNNGTTTTGADTIQVHAISKFDPISKSIVPISSFSANSTPSTGDLWSIGEFTNINNYYTSKSGKLFKVTSITRNSKEESVKVTGIEYISNIYVDSDTFINYEPTAYTDIPSPLLPPPAPLIDFYAKYTRRLDGTVAVDGIINNYTDTLGIGQNFETEYYLANPLSSTLISNAYTTNAFTVVTSNTAILSNGAPAAIVGKSGFTSPIGELKLQCSAVTSNASYITLSIDGLSDCYDDNFSAHVLDTNSANVFGSLKGANNIVIPIVDKSSTINQLNFIGYSSDTSYVSRPINSNTSNSITIPNTITNSISLSNLLPSTPFNISISQLLANNNYAANTFYVTGTSKHIVVTGNLTNSTTEYIPLNVKPRNIEDVQLYIDGILKNSGQYSVTLNYNNADNAFITYTKATSDTTFRYEVDFYTVPSIELGDSLQVSSSNVFSVLEASYIKESNIYNASLTANNIYKVQLAETPNIELAGASFINISSNPTGYINNVYNNTCSFDYSNLEYPTYLHLANSSIYTLEVDSNYDKVFLSKDLVIKDLPLGVTSLMARNKSALGRTSSYVHKDVLVLPLPIQKVTNISIDESLYREQTGGVSVRVTCSFDHIINQEVTDYEISYRLSTVENINGNDAGVSLTNYNTVKVSASGVTSEGRISFTVSGVNRGAISGSNSITFRITPINNSIRGVTTTKSATIIGKTAAPLNIIGLSGGQQDTQITLFWQYVRKNGDLFDIDLKEVIIRKIPGTKAATLSNYIVANDLVTVSAGTARKSIPIDMYGTFTYLVRTKDTSGNYSDTVEGITLTTVKPKKTNTIAAYNEDNPYVSFASINNNNTNEYYFPSFANSNTGGLSYSYSSPIDNANGSSTGFSVIIGSATDILAESSSTYITPIRDMLTEVTASIVLTNNAYQVINNKWNDQHIDIFSSVSDISTSSNVLIDTSFGGIGHVLGFNNSAVVDSRFDANNQTIMDGGVAGNVWGIWNYGQYIGDYANANSYALVAGVINANAIELGATFYANGSPTSANYFSNITSAPSTYSLVNFRQYNDTGVDATYVGDLGAVTSQIFIRVATNNVYFANGNVNVLAFIGSASSNGWAPFTTSTRRFRYFQLKQEITNNNPGSYDYTIDTLRYTVDKEQTIFTTTVPYTSSPTNVDYSTADFIYRPTITYTIIDQVDAQNNTAIVVTTAASNNQLSFNIFASNGSGQYLANSSANVMITAIGV